MQIDPRLIQITDCLYRVATKAVIVREDKVLLVKEIPEMWWGFPGGGVNYGESIEFSLVREICEELGLQENDIKADLNIIHYSIGSIVGGIPRMHVFYKVKIIETTLHNTDQVAGFNWFDKNEFMNINLSPSYGDRSNLAKIIFNN